MSEGFIIGNGGGGRAFGYIAALVPTDAESLICRMYANEQRTQLIGSIDGGAGIEAGQFLFHVPVRCWCEVEITRTITGGGTEHKMVRVNATTRGKIERALMAWKVQLYSAGDTTLFNGWRSTKDFGWAQTGATPTAATISNTAEGLKITVNLPAAEKSNCGGACTLAARDLTNYKVLHWEIVQDADSRYNSTFISTTASDPYNAEYTADITRTGGGDEDISTVNGTRYIILRLLTESNYQRNNCIINNVYIDGEGETWVS